VYLLCETSAEETLVLLPVSTEHEDMIIEMTSSMFIMRYITICVICTLFVLCYLSLLHHTGINKMFLLPYVK